MRRDELPEPLEDVLRRVLGAASLPLADRRTVERELRAHFEDGLAAGRTPDELADRFGDPEEVGRRVGAARRDRARRKGENDGRGWMMIETWWQETRRSARTLAKSPGFTALVVLTLALGVGANTAIFSVLDAAVLKSLPYPEADRLVRVYEAPAEDPLDHNYLRAPTVAAYRGWDDVFERFGALYTSS